MGMSATPAARAARKKSGRRRHPSISRSYPKRVALSRDGPRAGQTACETGPSRAGRASKALVAARSIQLAAAPPALFEVARARVAAARADAIGKLGRLEGRLHLSNTELCGADVALF